VHFCDRSYERARCGAIFLMFAGNVAIILSGNTPYEETI